MANLHVIEVAREDVFELFENIDYHRHDLPSAELYRFDHPEHGDTLLVVPSLGGNAAMIPIEALI